MKKLEPKFESSALRLSAVRAFLGRIQPTMRMIKVMEGGGNIVLTVVFDREPTLREIDDVSEAATEIVADFIDASITENSIVIEGRLPKENVVLCGWIFLRSEDGIS